MSLIASLAPAFAADAPASAVVASSQPAVVFGFAQERDGYFRGLQAWFMDGEGKVSEPVVLFSSADEAQHTAEVAHLADLASEVRFLRKGRVARMDDWQSYSDMVYLVARRLGINPPESAVPVYRGLVRTPTDRLSPEESQVRDELASQDKTQGAPRRYLFISDLVGAPQPALPPLEKRVVYVRRHGRKIKHVIYPPELAPPPKEVSVLAQIDWEKADELAEVADDNAHGWDRKPRESLRRYRRRLRHLRAHCYAWVRRDLEALGIWDAQLFRGYVPPTRHDRLRPIRASSFAIAMAKITSSDNLAQRTSLRELNLRVDPLVRGAIVVFAPKVCDYNSRDGHIEIITSVDPLQAASYKFHPVKTECLVKAANENKMHVYVPLLPETDPPVEPSSQAGR